MFDEDVDASSLPLAAVRPAPLSSLFAAHREDAWNGRTGSVALRV